MKRPKGFTLIELLIVVAIIAILAAIAVPNFLEAQVRAKVSRAKSDIRTLATALETYRVDNTAYPPAGYLPPRVLTLEDRWEFVTTPIAYITSIPPDPFGDMDVSISYVGPPWKYRTYDFVSKIKAIPGNDAFFDFLYMNTGRTGLWYAASQGPDRVPELVRGGMHAGTEYDPTNGTVSNGDIIRIGPGGEQL